VSIGFWETVTSNDSVCTKFLPGNQDKEQINKANKAISGSQKNNDETKSMIYERTGKPSLHWVL
jgi:hypothetical protein